MFPHQTHPYIPQYIYKAYNYVPVFLIRSYGTPNGAGRCSVAQCHNNTWAMLVQSKLGNLIANGSSTIGCWQLENAY